MWPSSHHFVVGYFSTMACVAAGPATFLFSWFLTTKINTESTGESTVPAHCSYTFRRGNVNGPFTLILSFTPLKHTSALPIHMSYSETTSYSIRSGPSPLFSIQPFPSIQNIYKELPFLPILDLQQQLLRHLLFHIMPNKLKTKPKYCKIKGTDRWKHLKSTSNTYWVHLVVFRSELLPNTHGNRNFQLLFAWGFLAWIQI